MRILHITAHLGGGVGKAISGMAILSVGNFGDEHRILLLQEPEKAGHVQRCRDNGIPVSVWDGDTAALEWAEVIAVSWWNHPVMARFLRNFPPCPARLVLWCHANGCHYPYLPFSLTQIFDKVLFTSPYSLDNPAWTAEERRLVAARAAVVYGMGDFHPEKISFNQRAENSSEFRIGYVGTLNYGKIHPAFVDFCRAVCARVPAARFVMAGDRDPGLENNIRAAGIWERFSFPGFVPDAFAMMRTFDVFGYLLNPEHYGTTENVLLEAMACGIPPVVLRQNVEQHIVPRGANFLIETPEEYGERIELLRTNPTVREEMGRQAREHVLRQYNSIENASNFRAACFQASREPDRPRNFSVMGDTPWQWFLFCLGGAYRERFQSALDGLQSGREAGKEAAIQMLRGCPPILKEERKSSLRHFAAAYPEDETLRILRKQMEE